MEHMILGTDKIEGMTSLYHDSRYSSLPLPNIPASTSPFHLLRADSALHLPSSSLRYMRISSLFFCLPEKFRLPTPHSDGYLCQENCNCGFRIKSTPKLEG